ncbi:MAG TPA: DUF3817 domain-containing protein [Mycobacteriales bacterium]|jgi:integral membrane protein|nr:DUF3817 domain-containing protein [Mycobacteriales bacterium]
MTVDTTGSAVPVAPRRDVLLTAYRVLAIVVGFGLLTLVFVGLPLEYGADHPGVDKIVGPVHGFLYIVYLLLAGQLWQRERWPLRFALPIGCAGFVPFLSFFAERRVTRAVRQRAASAPTAVPAAD